MELWNRKLQNDLYKVELKSALLRMRYDIFHAIQSFAVACNEFSKYETIS